MKTLERKSIRSKALRVSCILVYITGNMWSSTAIAGSAEAIWMPAAAPITYKMDKPDLSVYNRAPATTNVPYAELSSPALAAPQIMVQPEISAPVTHAPIAKAPSSRTYDLSNIDDSLYKHMKLGNTYSVAGKKYTPKHEPDYDRTGVASWYGSKFHGKPTANGEIYDKMGLTAAHKTLPLNSYVVVTNLDTGKQVKVRLNDRGPFIDDRLIDLSEAAATELGITHAGLSRVRIQYAGPADPSDAGEKIALMPQSAPPVKASPQSSPEDKVAEVAPYRYKSLRQHHSAPTPQAVVPQVIAPAPEKVEPEVSPEVNIEAMPLDLPSAPVVKPAPKTPDTYDLTVENIDLSNPKTGIPLPKVQIPENMNEIPKIPTIGSLGESENEVITLTIKGPIHMAKHSGTQKNAKGRLIPAKFEEK